MTNLSKNILWDNDSAGIIKGLPEDSETVIQFIQANTNPIAEEYRNKVQVILSSA